MPVPSPTTRVQPFLLRGYHGEPTRGSVTIHEFDREHRVRRAVAGLGKWWGVGLLTVELAADARGTCPDCGAEQRLDLAVRWRAPQPVTCQQCHRGLQLVLPTS